MASLSVTSAATADQTSLGLALSGPWTARGIGASGPILDVPSGGAESVLIIDRARVEAPDTADAWVLHKLLRRLRDDGSRVEMRDLRPDFAKLLEVVEQQRIRWRSILYNIRSACFASPRIIYVREAHKLEYFAHSEWIDPLLVAAISNTGIFRAVVLTPSAAASDLRLDTKIIRLQHEFGTLPSHARFTLRAYLVDNKTRQVLAWREFDTTVAAASENPYGGVVAVNRAVAIMLENLAIFFDKEARNAVPKK